MIDIIWCDLRDIMILTIQATEIAARTGKRKTRGSRMEVVERFLLNGVDGQCTGLTIDLADEYAIMIHATLAAPRLAIGNMTMMGTELALHHPVIQSLIISTLHHS